MPADFTTLLTGHVRETLDLRLGAELPTVHAAPSEVLGNLLDVRRRIDRVEELLSQVLRARARAQRAAKRVSRGHAMGVMSHPASSRQRFTKNGRPDQEPMRKGSRYRLVK